MKTSAPCFFALLLAILPASASALTYADWIASYGLTGADAAEAADPDSDGIPNLIEYALADFAPNTNDWSLLETHYTRLGFCARVGDALDSYGAWYANRVDRSLQSSDTFHPALRFKPRVGATGIRYAVQVSHGASGLFQWHSGRAAIYDQQLTGGYWQAVGKMPVNRIERVFMRLAIITDASASNPLAGLNPAPATP